MMKVLVCGGAGYIGSHMVRLLCAQGFEVIVFDNLATGHRAAVGSARLIEGDLLDPSGLRSIFTDHDFDVVIHLSALSIVSASVSDPFSYYRNNVSGSLNLLSAMKDAGVGKIVFSSTAAIFGLPQADSIDENHPANPINPYGVSKLMVEHMLTDAARAYGLRSVTLRYFNAAGADPSGLIGESHLPETHLIPNVLLAALGRGSSTVKIFGTDYATRDGTCVRDYVHVNDLAQAHLRSISYMETHEGAHAFNLGNGHGFTVNEVIAAARAITGRKIVSELAARRVGDPPVLVASSAKARALLKWQPSYVSIEEIIETAWRWHSNQRY